MKTSLPTLLRARTLLFDSLMRRDLADHVHSPLLIQVINHIVFNGGKRLRPMLTVLLHSLCRRGEAPDQHRAYNLALCFEYLHAASLLHDDVIDHATHRRNHRTAHQIWGNTSVILAGDFLHSRALLLAGTEGGAECLEIVCEAVEAMVEAEYLQLQNTASRDLSDAHYFQVLRGKTAMLISAACETGCIVAAASPAQRRAARTFGNNIGLAFQIIDDILDYTGESARTGKIPGNDWREQRVTLPLIHALERVEETDRQWLLSRFSAPRAIRERSFPAAAALIQQAGGIARTRDRAGQLIDEAVSALEIFPDREEKTVLTALSRYILQREH